MPKLSSFGASSVRAFGHFLSPSIPDIVDHSFSSVSLLLKTNGVAGAATFVDVSPINNTFNVYPSAIASNSVSHSGAGSVALSSSGYLDLVDSNISAFNFGTGDYTLECFIYANSLTSGPCILSKYSTWASTVSFNLEVYSTGAVRYIGGNSTVLILLSSTGVVTTNAWHHLAVTCTSGTTRLFVNGVIVATDSTVNSISSTSTHPFCIGKDSYAASQYFDGYVEDVRITKGVSRYTANFTSPTTTFWWSGFNTTDAYFSSVSLLIHADGTNGLTSFVDNSSLASTITTNGGTQVTTTSPKYGTGSALFDGTGDYISVPSSTSLDLGTVYTIEFWINPRIIDGIHNFGIMERGIYETGTSTWTELAFAVRLLWLGPVRTYFYGTVGNEQYVDTPASLTVGVWQHFAVVRNGTTAAIYVNGVSVATISGLNTPAASTRALEIGRFSFTTSSTPHYEDFDGKLDDIRITKGVARYTSNFVPSPVAFPNS